MSSPSHASHTSRLGRWLPSNRSVLNVWLKNSIQQAEENKKPFHPVVQEFQDLIERDPVLFMYFSQMFAQQPRFAPPDRSGDVKIKDYHQMLRVINHVLTTAPEFNDTEMVGFPINAILDFPMITPAGQAAFTNPAVNAMFKKILKVWTDFLNSPNSLYVLNDTPTGWLSEAAQKAIHLDEFVHDSSAPFYGFKSWNDFFIRQFKAGMRPVKAGMRPVGGEEDPKVIVSACESAPFAISTGVKQTDTFWIKSQPYSLKQMLDGQYVDEFVGGTVYQAFLSAEKYHRWHSPVSGTIRRIRQVDGTYYAEAASEGFDEAGPNNSQGYIAHTATRALIFIDADEPGIGLMCLMPVGMAEVSSCVVTVNEGQHVAKGDQVGYFQFGGSTHCLVFRPGVIGEFALQAIPQGQNGANSSAVKVNSPLAIASGVPVAIAAHSS
ncbi:MAG TPA: phosphatidylserine decarboxylase family protein [Bryobacteraceae bacterium]|nr:phosphatidylserine decarboxylase family protein [Bryobacteraceae bacterium]